MNNRLRNAVTLGLPLMCVAVATLHGGDEEAAKLPVVKTEVDASGKIQWKKHTVLPKVKGMHFSAAAADFTGDGKVDVIGSVAGKTILFHAPDWKQEHIHTLKGNSRARHVAAEPFDFDGDGDLDLVGGNAGGPLLWIENPSKKGTQWTEHIIDDETSGIHCIILFDVNKDGKMDVLSNNFGLKGPLASSCTWYEFSKNADGKVEWDRHIFAKGDASGGSHYLGAGDVNGDGWPDIAVGAKGVQYPDGNWFAYWLNPGAAKINEPWEKVLLLEGQEGATNIQIMDVDADGTMDFICTNGHGKGVFWLEMPSKTIHMIDAEMECPHNLTIADFDGDGILDFATNGFKSKRASIYYGKVGSFRRVDIDIEQKSYDLKSIDMDGDGDLDILNAGQASGNICWYENPAK